MNMSLFIGLRSHNCLQYLSPVIVFKHWLIPAALHSMIRVY